MSSKVSYVHQLTRNLVLISASPRSSLSNQRLGQLAPFKGNWSRSEHGLCIIPGWFAAKQHNLLKFAQYYLDQDFDVLLAMTTVSQVFSPTSAVKTFAKDALEFCYNNQEHYGPIVVHGFSVGAVCWGCLLTYVNRNPDKFKFLHDKIAGQVWDSPWIEMDRLPQTGGAMAFPNSPLLNKATELFLRCHTMLQRPESNFFENTADAFHNLNIKSSFILFTSEDDWVTPSSAVEKCAKGWQNQGCEVYCKIWQRSPHVRHMKENPEEYTTLLKGFLTRIAALKYPDRFQIAKKKATEGHDSAVDLVVKIR